MQDSETSTSTKVETKTVSPEGRTPGGRTPGGRTGRWRTLLRFALIAILVLLVVHLAAGWAARAKLQQARERVVNQGHSLKFSDFAPADLAAGENATDFLEAAGLLLEAQRQEGEVEGVTVVDELSQRLREIDREQAAVTPEDLALFRRAVDAGDLALRVLDEGMTRERARWNVDYYTRNPAALEIPNLMLRLRLTSLLRARARLALEDGRPEAAYREAGKIFRVAGWIAEEMPVLIHTLIATRVARDALATAEALMQRVPPTAAEMAHLLAEARRWDPQQAYDRALAAERAATFTTFLDRRSWRTLAEVVVPVPLASRVARAAFGSTWFYANAAAYSDAMTAMIEACRPPGHLRREGRPGRFKELFVPPRWAAVARSIMPNLLEACAKRDALAARLDLMEIAFRLEEHRRETGAYPPSLDPLTDVPAVDPWSGEPYRYRLDDGGAAVYSVGGNRVDDGGTPPAPDRTKSVPELHRGDIVWRLPQDP